MSKRFITHTIPHQGYNRAELWLDTQIGTLTLEIAGESEISFIEVDPLQAEQLGRMLVALGRKAGNIG